MLRYFSRVIRNGEVLPDDGVPEEFLDLATAKCNAIEGARQILSNAVLAGKAGNLDMRIELQDEAGNPLFTVSCGRVVDSDTQD